MHSREKISDLVVFSLLDALESENIPYVSWKNNHQLESVMSGKGDIDLFVPFDSRAKFFDLCKNLGWIEVVNPLARYPWVHHLFGMDEDFSIYHIHVYFKVVTGESWLKEYLLPLDQWLIENRVWSREHNIWILDSVSQAHIFAVRHLMKGASVSSRLLYASDLDSYREEWMNCEQEPDVLKMLGPIDISKYLAGSSILKDELRLPKLLTALSFRFSISPFLRYQWWSLPIRRSITFMQRLVNKLFHQKKKLLPHGGLVIAVSGVDGAGKSTMLKELDQVFDQFLTLERFHLGRPQGKLVEFVWRNMGNTSNNSTIPGCAQVSLPSSTGRAFNAVFLALLRLRMARIAVKRANQGSLVLVDRWPTDQIGKMDGPRIVIGNNPRIMLRIFERIESWAYSSMPRADICYFFVLPMSVAIERNRTRIKDNKETDEQITARFKGNLDYHPLARKTIHFDNAGDFKTKRKEFLANVWHEIISH